MPTSPSGGGFKSEGPKLTFSLDNTKTVPFETPIPATETKSAIGFEPPIPAGKRGLKARSMPEPTAGTLKSLMERSAPTTSNDFVGAWNLVHEALKTEAPDTLVRSRFDNARYRPSLKQASNYTDDLVPASNVSVQPILVVCHDQQLKPVSAMILKITGSSGPRMQSPTSWA